MFTPSILRFHYENVLRQYLLLKTNHTYTLEVFQFDEIRRVSKARFSFHSGKFQFTIVNPSSPHPYPIFLQSRTVISSYYQEQFEELIKKPQNIRKNFENLQNQFYELEQLKEALESALKASAGGLRNACLILTLL